MVAEEKVNVLIVDDTPANLLALEAVLADLDQNLVKASSGREALKCLLQQDFAVILLDVNMPDIDGFETATLIRQRQRSEHTPIIFITAHDATETGRARGYSLGAVDYIYAPVVPEILRAKVASFVELTKVQLLHQHAEEWARQEAARAKTLARIAARLNAQLDFQTVLSTVCQETARALEAPAALVALYDERQQAFCLSCDFGLPQQFSQQVKQIPGFLYNGSGEWAEQVHVIPDIQAISEDAEADYYATLDIRSSASAVMVRDSRPVGCLTVFTFQEARHFTGDEQIFLRGLADQATLAIANARLFDEVHNKQRQLRHLAQKLVVVQEEERQHISRELHDQAGQVLVALQISLKLLKQEITPGFGMAHQRLDEAIDLAETVIDDVRTLAHTLRPPMMDERGLNGILEGLCKEFARYTHLTIHYQGTDVLPLLDTTPISLYRFLQEALTNAAKHAQAKQIQVTLSQNIGRISLAVEDDGVGFNPQERQPSNGIGLVGMQERFEMLGGLLEIDSHPGRGTRLVATVPLKGSLQPSESALSGN
ncbi:MAG: response regulator [Chloroflexi bacterium]|nr:response regulator [Chloroflexota bacterium]MCI0579945.1 response regulator [Chloroflexota bacterium]MCI0646528.1 response regulator [Chloroflexota bacterium]MCI0726120.1 response regulator [Chloroflexota bacterium]